MAVTNKMLNQHREDGCFAITMERKYYHIENTFIKRSLRPREWQVSPIKGTIHVPRLGRERILNEAATLKYIRENSDIPVPTLHGCFEDDGATYLTMDYVDGVSMNSLTDDQKKIVTKELEGHIRTLYTLRSRNLGGVSGIVVPPYRAMQKTFRDDWNLKPSSTDEFVLCHNDLSQQNVIIDPHTSRITAIIDWEYAGFFPEKFDRCFYERLGPSVALKCEEDDSEMIVDFFKKHVA
jgi:serine/threonine protein kinase